MSDTPHHAIAAQLRHLAKRVEAGECSAIGLYAIFTNGEEYKTSTAVDGASSRILIGSLFSLAVGQHAVQTMAEAKAASQIARPGPQAIREVSKRNGGEN